MPHPSTSRLSPLRRDAVWDVRARQTVAYEVVLTGDLLDPAHDSLARAGIPAGTPTPTRRCVVTEQTIDDLYGDRLRAYFEAHGIDVHWLVLDSGEQNKGMEAVLRAVAAFDAFGILRRQEPVIAVGGGVLTDIVGFACGMFRRGLPHVKVPTTLMGLVDAGIGAKAGVNHAGGKNRIGCYHPPRATLLDPAFLDTLPDRQISNGLAEILKIALVLDAHLFDLLEEFGPLLRAERFQGHTADGERAADEVLRRAIGGMLAELEPNLWEHELERAVDYGHTFSPAVEMHALPALLHGEAVAVDMALTTVISWRRGLLGTAQLDRVLAVMTSLGLPTSHAVCRADLLTDALADTVRHRDGRQRMPLATDIGSAHFVDDVTVDEVRGAAAHFHDSRNR
ncbi:sedoheptulose 7-phosphate cyclase [Streptomyces pseudovenezuelae]|uniref:2-epi-5-epi-valiolone synthase n=1 Tax=Streptomyces pseudovenezuelae TaxID=67350 RepID=A0ABT6LPJ2_9ACTN|nr:sedoheptulose 7-phosphate cyclase [Streptomyces pseudovenezuelae]MDH6218220.1 3-dehydroquinate synthetase [Streptomyces pseudovenezuelae]